MASLKTIQKALTLPYRWGVSNPRSLANFLWWSLLPVTPALLSMAFMTVFSMVQKSAHHSKVKESRCAIYFLFFSTSAETSSPSIVLGTYGSNIFQILFKETSSPNVVLGAYGSNSFQITFSIICWCKKIYNLGRLHIYRYTILFLSILDIIQERRNVNLPVYIKSIWRPDQLFMTPNHGGIFLKLFLETLMFPSFTSFSRVSNFSLIFCLRVQTHL